MRFFIFSFFLLFGLSTARAQTIPNTNIWFNSTSNFLGVGVSDPLTHLHVNGNVAAATYSGGPMLGFVQMWSDNAVIWKSGNQNGGLRFGSATDLGAGGWLERMRLTDNGSLCIGTQGAVAKLDVFTDASSSPFNILYLHTASFVTGGNAQASYFLRAVDDGNGVTQFMIRGDGAVGIGTALPGSNKLAVEGTIGARKVVVTQTAPFPDYVFDRGYRLPSLDSVGRYIEAHHHLSEMPSAESVARSGLDLGDNQTILLKKIEELTLYIIEQDKILKAQESRLRRLEQLKND
jgi:hypothetical protein